MSTTQNKDEELTVLDQVIKHIEDLYRFAASAPVGTAWCKINGWEVLVHKGSLFFRSGYAGWRSWTRTKKEPLAEILVKYTHRVELWAMRPPTAGLPE